MADCAQGLLPRAVAQSYAVNAMLLNEFLKEHQTVQELKTQVAELTAGLLKVNAQLEASKPAPQMVVNDQ